jgi:DNA-binding GntR family transcriptional regulator
MPQLPTSQPEMRHRTMAEYALDQLREAIVLGELPAGTPLRLDELAKSLGMSISPIREAVRQLESLGLAKHVPHQGARVLEFDVTELQDLFEVRLALESLAVRRASERFSDVDENAARLHLARFDEASAAGDIRGTLRAHTEFHFALYEASAAPWLVALIRPAWHRSERFRPALLATASEQQRQHREVEGRLLEACVAHDPAAAAGALLDHLELASAIFEHELGGRGIFERA